RVLVTGATGMLGRAVVSDLLTNGHTVAAMSRRVRRWPEVEPVLADLTEGTGLDAAVDGVHAIVHLASAPYQRGYTDEVELSGTQRLLTAAAAGGVKHVVYTSIVGANLVPWGYFGTKVRAETIIRHSPVPWSIIRSTQFHDFVDQAIAKMSRLPLMISDRGVLGQPIDVRDVAKRITHRLLDGPSAEVEECGGPEILGFDQVIRQWQAVRGTAQPILHVRIPGKLGKGFRNGSVTTNERTGHITWKQYLTEKYGPSTNRQTVT
ncbi:NAD(P)H-binding protein, partial [Kribbella sp. NPDC051936]|uniref:SDR family oxidoreductase n=1 Tax=Kribbella sp. NPDC051936 TaxID=3154946 RepID=UPI0034366374